MRLDDLNQAYARFWFKLDSSTRQNIWRKLAKQLSDGIPIISGLEEMRGLMKPKAPAAQAIDDWLRGMNNGRKLSDVVAPWVGPEEAMLIVAGEESGTLDEALHSVVKVSQAGADIRGAVIGGLAYPAFLLMVCFAVMYFFGFKIIPAFARAAQTDSWTGQARIMIDVAAFIQGWLYWIALGALLILIAFFISLPRWNGRARVFLDRYAPFSVYRVMQGSTWLIALSALVQAGMRIESAIEELGKRSTAWARVRCDAALRGLRSGRNLGEALERSGLEFPDREIISDLRLYAKKSGFDEALRIIGDEWITQSVKRVKSLMNVVFIVALLLVGCIVIFIALGFSAMQKELLEMIRRGGF